MREFKRWRLYTIVSLPVFFLNLKLKVGVNSQSEPKCIPKIQGCILALNICWGICGCVCVCLFILVLFQESRLTFVSTHSHANTASAFSARQDVAKLPLIYLCGGTWLCSFKGCNLQVLLRPVVSTYPPRFGAALTEDVPNDNLFHALTSSLCYTRISHDKVPFLVQQGQCTAFTTSVAIARFMLLSELLTALLWNRMCASRSRLLPVHLKVAPSALSCLLSRRALASVRAEHWHATFLFSKPSLSHFPPLPSLLLMSTSECQIQRTNKTQPLAV